MIKSDTDPVDAPGEYGATDMQTVGEDCASPIHVEVATPIVVGTNIEVCAHAKVDRTELTSTRAEWSGPEVGEYRKIETVFEQTVPATMRPIYHITFGVPQYLDLWTVHHLWHTFVSKPYNDPNDPSDDSYSVNHPPLQYETDTPPPSGGGSVPVGPALVRDSGDGTMKIWRWTSNRDGFDRASDYTSGPFHLDQVGDRVASGDVDGDGKDDIVMAYQNSDGTMQFNVFKSGITSAGVWYHSGPFSLGPVAGRLVVGDFNGDGKAEPALVRDNGDGTMKIWRWLSTGTSFTRTTDYQSGPFHLDQVGDRVAAGDVDGDGKADIVMAYQTINGTFQYNVFKNGYTSLGIWYTSGPFTLDPVAGRLTLGTW